jgi:hypothetical protein
MYAAVNAVNTENSMLSSNTLASARDTGANMIEDPPQRFIAHLAGFTNNAWCLIRLKQRRYAFLQSNRSGIRFSNNSSVTTLNEIYPKPCWLG